MKTFFKSIQTLCCKSLIFYALLLATMLLKYCPFGIAYYPYQDDYNAYGAFYHLIQEGATPWSLFVDYKMYTARPLAGFLDAFVIAPLWPHLWLMLLVLTALHLLTLPLLEGVFKKMDMPWGRAASLAFGLYPLLAESTYWINAASRFVPSFFCLALSAYGLGAYSAGSRKKFDLIYGLAAGFLSLWFYEQAVAFGFVLYVILFVQHRTQLLGNAKALLAWPFVYAALFSIYYVAFISQGRQAARATLTAAPLAQMGRMIKDIGILLVKEQRYNLTSLAKTEFGRLPTPAVILALAAAVLLALALYAEPVAPARGIKKSLMGFIKMGLLFFAPFAPFFVLESSFLSLRNIFYSVVMLAVAAQWVVEIASRRVWTKWIGCLLAVAVIWISLLFNMGEVSAFKINSQTDRVIAQNLLEALESSKANTAYQKVWLLGANYQYNPHGGVHLHSSTLSDWALTGLVNVLAVEAGGASYGQYGFAQNGGYFLNPVVPGWRYSGSLHPEKELLLGIAPDLTVRRFYYEEGTVFEKDTGEAWGYLSGLADFYYTEF